ncbi:serine-rich protein, partial [Moniliophthora roreri]
MSSVPARCCRKSRNVLHGAFPISAPAHDQHTPLFLMHRLPGIPSAPYCCYQMPPCFRQMYFPTSIQPSRDRDWIQTAVGRAALRFGISLRHCVIPLIIVASSLSRRLLSSLIMSSCVHDGRMKFVLAYSPSHDTTIHT